MSVKSEKKRNYQRELEQCLATLSHRPKLLLQCCCAPCSSYVLEYLVSYFDITVFFYNPNISPESEYDIRKQELLRLTSELKQKRGWSYDIRFADTRYDASAFFSAVRGHESDREGGARCTICYELRLRETAAYAREHCFDYFTTTLSISPRKDADRLNVIGERLADEYGVSYLTSDFKKKNGYKRSIELSREFELYRQDYCGCVFSKAERMAQLQEKKIGESIL